jgi:hypothetical protein
LVTRETIADLIYILTIATPALIDLAIALIDSKNRVSESNDILYALEVPKGFFKQNNIVIGDDFQLFK